MKEFVKIILAVICAFVIMGILRFLFFLLILGSAAMSGSGPAVPKTGGVLDINMSQFVLAEQTNSDPVPQFSLAGGVSTTTASVGLRDAVLALEEAANDPAIKFAYLRADAASAGVAQMEEFRKALAAFRNSGKPVLAYTEAPSNGSYYLASVADKILMGKAHGGTYMLVGLSSQLVFLKDILDKLGVNVRTR